MSTIESMGKNGWGIDRRVPVMLFLILGVQIGTALIWAGGMSERVTRLESVAAAQSDMAERLARQEEKLRHILEALARIEARLERMEGIKGMRQGAGRDNLLQNRTVKPGVFNACVHITRSGGVSRGGACVYQAQAASGNGGA